MMTLLEGVLAVKFTTTLEFQDFSRTIAFFWTYHDLYEP